MSQSRIRENPPSSVSTFAEEDKYRTLYDDITNNGVILQYHHRHALGELACMLVEMERLRESLREDGVWMEVSGDKGSTIRKRNPAQDALDKLRTQTTRYFREFRMTPGSAGKTMSVPGQGSDKTEDGWDDV